MKLKVKINRNQIKVHEFSQCKLKEASQRKQERKKPWNGGGSKDSPYNRFHEIYIYIYIYVGNKF